MTPSVPPPPLTRKRVLPEACSRPDARSNRTKACPVTTPRPLPNPSSTSDFRCCCALQTLLCSASGSVGHICKGLQSWPRVQKRLLSTPHYISEFLLSTHQHHRFTNDAKETEANARGKTQTNICLLLPATMTNQTPHTHITRAFRSISDISRKNNVFSLSLTFLGSTLSVLFFYLRAFSLPQTTSIKPDHMSSTLPSPIDCYRPVVLACHRTVDTLLQQSPRWVSRYRRFGHLPEYFP